MSMKKLHWCRYLWRNRECVVFIAQFWGSLNHSTSYHDRVYSSPVADPFRTSSSPQHQQFTHYGSSSVPQYNMPLPSLVYISSSHNLDLAMEYVTRELMNIYLISWAKESFCDRFVRLYRGYVWSIYLSGNEAYEYIDGWKKDWFCDKTRVHLRYVWTIYCFDDGENENNDVIEQRFLIELHGSSHSSIF